MNKKLMKKTKSEERAITLIALVVTIVVLLILAAVSISMLAGENGIIAQAQKAKGENIIAEEKETITLAISAIKTRLENVNKDNLKQEIEKIKNKETVEVTEIGDNLLEVKFDKTGNVYKVNKDGELVDLETKLNASYEFDTDAKELYINPYIENLEEISQVMSKEEWIESLQKEMSTEQKEKMFLDTFNIGTGSSYKTIDEFLADTGSSSIDEFIKNESQMEEITNLDQFIYEMGYQGTVIIENPDGSLNPGRIYIPTNNGYPAEIGQTYTFKIRFMGIEIEKIIKIQDLSDWEWKVNDDGRTVTITKYKGHDTTVIIPNEIYGMQVTEIGIGEGYYASGVANFESLWDNSICELTYFGCGSAYTQSTITKVIIPEGINKINDGAFEYSYALEEIQFSNAIESIGNFAFYYCSSLTSINIPNTVISIGEHAFSNCSNLTSINIPNTVTSIGELAFSNCSSLTSINIPNSIKSIEYGVFGNCSSLTSINIPDSIISIGNYAFIDCSSLTSINIPNSVTSIGEYAFSNCRSLTSIYIPNSVTSIGRRAFDDCSSLTSINIPDSVTSIGEYAFSSCSSLTSIYIPNSVTSIGRSVFYECSSLATINIEASTIPETWDSYWKNQCTATVNTGVRMD